MTQISTFSAKEQMLLFHHLLLSWQMEEQIALLTEEISPEVKNL